MTRYLKKRPAEFIASPFYQGFSGVSGKLALESPDTVKKIVEAFKKADEFIRTNENESRRILANRTNLQEEQAIKVPVSPFVLVKGMDENQKEAAQKLSDFFFDKKILESRIIVESMWEK
jgi:ABC-type nitrate/sulfonate/bicarbonate transport system substrate-binding protein